MRASALSKEMVNPSSVNAHRSAFHSFQNVLCLVLSVFLVLFCIVITLRTSHLEHRMQFLESERFSVLSSAPPSLQENLSLWDAIEKLIQKVSGKVKLDVFHRDEELQVLYGCLGVLKVSLTCCILVR